MTVKVDSQAPGFLVLSELYYPGWQAYVDGQEAKIYRANYAFRAVYSDKGQHDVEFRFRPWSFYTGAAITGISLLGVVIYFWIALRNRLRSPLKAGAGIPPNGPG
ncbi:MAG: YfhO family protein [Chloroflexi bacterium]|nr:YfhO family protein [Chloroflexota bacterium]